MYNGSSIHSHHFSKIAVVIPTVRVSTVGFQLLCGVIARFHVQCSMWEGERGREEERRGRERGREEERGGREKKREKREVVGGRQLATRTYVAHNIYY